MAQAALQEEFTFPAGGIADFYKDDEELAAMDREDAQRAFGNNGIANFQDVATRMASYGRYGDDKLVHAETGELIVPKALIEDNPKLRDSIFGHLRDMGIEDPERYVVGSRANSINPDTGLPEFFLKKLFKKVSRAVKKVSKKVLKVAKKAAPLILPFVLGPAGLGLNMLYAGALGAGIGTLVQGGSVKDALKNALIGGAVGGVSQGISSGMAAGKGNFMQGFSSGVKSAATNPMQASFTQAMEGSILSGPDSPVFDVAKGDAAVSATDVATTDVADAFRADGLQSRPVVLDGTPTGAVGDTAAAAATDAAAASPSFVSPPKPPGFFESVKGAFTPGDNVGFFEGMKDAFIPSGTSFQEVLEMNNINPLQATAEQITAAKEIAAKASPGFARTFAPAAATGLTALYAGGGFEAPEVEESDLGPTGAEMLRLTPYEYLIGQQNLRTRGSQGRTVVPTAYAAEGGEIFPRRVGGIMPNEGTPGKDSVRAMLMPGEFVMTTDAVKGLGNGDNDKGISNMYQMMRGLEAKGRAMA